MNIKRAILALAFTALVSTSEATIIKVTYDAAVTDISSTLVGGPISMGDSISGSYVIDTESGYANIQRWGVNDQWSQTFFEGALRESSATIGSEHFDFLGGFVRTDPNTPGKTSYSVYTRNNLVSTSSPQINGLAANSLSVTFSQFSSIYPLDVIPEVLPPFDPTTDPAYLFLRFTRLGNDYIRGDLTSVSIETFKVPDHSTLFPIELLLSMGMLVIVRRKRS